MANRYALVSSCYILSKLGNERGSSTSLPLKLRILVAIGTIKYRKWTSNDITTEKS